MKNPSKFFGIIAAIFVLAGCTGNPATPASVPDDLDIAIREASDYLNDSIPRGSKIVILNVQSGSDALSNYIIDELIANAVNDRNFEVVDRQQLDLIRAEQNFQMSGEVDDSHAQAIGRFFGAQTIVSGQVSELGNRYRLAIRALDVETSRVQGQFNRNLNAGETIIALMRSGTSSVGAVGGSTAQARPVATAPAQPAGSSAGTYTFFPRIQGFRNGIPANLYIDKVVVRGNHMLIYITGTPRGGGMPDGTTGWQHSRDNMLTDLDRPARSWPRSGFNQDNISTEGIILSFENVSATRFSLDIDFNPGGHFLFEEIILGEPD